MVAMATTEHGKTKSLSCGSGPRFGCNSGMYKYFAELPCAVPGIAWFESLGSAFVVCYVLAGLPPSIYQYTHFAELELNFLVLPHHLHWVLPLLSLCRMPTSVPETVQTPSFSASAPSAKKKNNAWLLIYVYRYTLEHPCLQTGGFRVGRYFGLLVFGFRNLGDLCCWSSCVGCLIRWISSCTKPARLSDADEVSQTS